MGGTNTICFAGCGTVFQISSNGVHTTLHSFTILDGARPEAGLLQGTDGNFYGTASRGGNTNLNPNGYGTVFRLSPSGSFTNLHSFTGSDGAVPWGWLVQGSEGDFYGTTYSGGTHNSGTVFKITSSGVLTNLWSFTGGSDGANPYAGLAQGSEGDFYGTTYRGGTYNSGTVFRTTSTGILTNLHSFTGGSDGGNPIAGLLQGSDGNFYGTTRSVGTSLGTIFRISTSGVFTTRWSFANDANGSNPQAGLVQGSDGYFYGTTSDFNHSHNFGTVFKLVVPLNPPPNQISAIQLADTNVIITIPSVAGETYQLQFRESLTDGVWSNIVAACVSNSLGASLTLTNFGGASQPQRFYRFNITP